MNNRRSQQDTNTSIVQLRSRLCINHKTCKPLLKILSDCYKPGGHRGQHSSPTYTGDLHIGNGGHTTLAQWSGLQLHDG